MLYFTRLSRKLKRLAQLRASPRMLRIVSIVKNRRPINHSSPNYLHQRVMVPT